MFNAWPPPSVDASQDGVGSLLELALLLLHAAALAVRAEGVLHLDHVNGRSLGLPKVDRRHKRILRTLAVNGLPSCPPRCRYKGGAVMALGSLLLTSHNRIDVAFLAAAD